MDTQGDLPGAGETSGFTCGYRRYGARKNPSENNQGGDTVERERGRRAEVTIHGSVHLDLAGNQGFAPGCKVDPFAHAPVPPEPGFPLHPDRCHSAWSEPEANPSWPPFWVPHIIGHASGLVPTGSLWQGHPPPSPSSE